MYTDILNSFIDLCKERGYTHLDSHSFEFKMTSSDNFVEFECKICGYYIGCYNTLVKNINSEMIFDNRLTCEENIIKDIIK